MRSKPGVLGRSGDVSEWVTTVLLQGTGRVDGVLFREAYSAVSRGELGSP